MPSTVVRRFHYQPERRELVIEFVSGRIYIYSGVPEDVAKGLEIASSKGRYFNLRIRDHYDCREVTGELG